MKIVFALFFYHLFLMVSMVYVRFFSCDFSLCENYTIWLDVSFLGLAGGCTYCMRSLYIQYCVKKDWDNRWILWHLIRPLVSTSCGFVSLLFVKAGLLIFEASSVETSDHYGIYSLAFIAGLNVDNFIKKIESIFKEMIGIKETNISREK